MRPYHAVSIVLALSTCSTYTDSWPQLGGNAQHTGLSAQRSRALDQIRWSALVDQSGNGVSSFTHYGTPVVTARGTVVIAVRQPDPTLILFEGHRLDSGDLVWSEGTGFKIVPPLDPVGNSIGAVVTPSGDVVLPGPGGTIFRRKSGDDASSDLAQQSFLGMSAYQANKATLDDKLALIGTPAVGRHSEVYFPFGAPDDGHGTAGVTSGLARIDRNGAGAYVQAADLLGEAGQFISNSTPALGNDGRLLYAAAITRKNVFHLFALDTATLAKVYDVRLTDANGRDAVWIPDSTASPLVGPDGDVYFGVMTMAIANDRGLLRHFDATLAMSKFPGAFGWDDTPSIVPAKLVPSYKGSSSYLIFTKYNNYFGFPPSGDGLNKIALLDPNASEVDPVTSAAVMKEVMTVLGPTPDPEGRSAGFPNAVHEWCINTAAIDPYKHSVLVGNEDGLLYRWDFGSGRLSESIRLAPPLGEPYTPTVVAPDGSVIAINNAVMFVIGAGR
jgi:hypothetical protein